ncbi:MAG: FGGY-family carbohydrate kinase [Propionicimonas sp.]
MSEDRRLLIGIDGGTQSTKVIVYDTAGRIVAEASQPLRPMDMPVRGVAEHPEDDLWESLKAAARAAMSQLAERRSDVVGIGLCSIRFCRALVRTDGTLAHPILSWMDERVGRPHQPDPEVAYVTAASAYLTMRLTGRVADSVANYAGIWPVDHERWDWSLDDDDLAAMGLNRSQLPELLLPGAVLGTVTGEAAEATGLPAGVPVAATGNDKAVEALGNGLLDSDQLLLSLGTYITAMRPCAVRRPDAEHHWTNFACRPFGYLDESNGIRRGMSTISWIRDLVRAELDERAAAQGCRVEDVMNAEAVKVAPGSDGLLTVLDWLAPADAPHRRGAMVGFDARHGWPHMYRSMLEGIAMTMRLRTDAMVTALGQQVTSIIVSGGGSASDPMMQIVADVFGVPSQRAHVASGASLGAAICAAVATGVHADIPAAAQAMTRVAETFAPTQDGTRTYAGLLATYAELPTQLDATFRRIHQQGL